MSFEACLFAGILVGGAALSQLPSPLEDRDLDTAKPVLDPGQEPVKPFWPGEGDGGFTTVSYDVQKGGRPTNCRIVASSGIKKYDKLACDIVLRRTHYSPEFAGYGPEPRTGIQQTVRWASLYDAWTASDGREKP